MNSSDSDPELHLGAAYQEINQEIVRVHAYWKLALQLFGSNESVEILNRAGGFAIKVIQLSLIENILLRIAKLTDPGVQNKYTNLSLERLISEIAHKSESLREKLTCQLVYIKKSTERISFFRNKK